MVIAWVMPGRLRWGPALLVSDLGRVVVAWAMPGGPRWGPAPACEGSCGTVEVLVGGGRRVGDARRAPLGSGPACE